MWLLFLVMHIAGSVGYNLLLRRALVKQVDSLTLATLMQTAIVLPVPFIWFFAQPDLSVFDLKSGAVVVVTALLVVCLHLSNVKALQYLEVGVYSVLYNLRIAFTTVLGIVFLGEDIVPVQILGGLLIFLAVVIVRQKGRKDITAHGIRWGVGSAVAISLLNFAEKDLINNVGFAPYAIAVMTTATVFMWTIMLVRKKTIPMEVIKEPRTIGLLVLRIMSAFGFTLAFYAGASLSVATYIASLGVIATVGLGVVLLKENDYLKQKIWAAILAVVGLSFILISNF